MDIAFDRTMGCWIGLFIGDAVGTTNEFVIRSKVKPINDMVGGGHFNLKPGEWTDDGSMALCLAESLLKYPEFQPDDVMDRWLKWYRHGHNSVTGTCFDVGNQVRKALERWEKRRTFAEDVSRGAGNGCIMRLAPVIVKHHRDRDLAWDVARRQTITTHHSYLCLDITEQLTVDLLDLVFGVDISADYDTLSREVIKSTGFVKDTYEAARWSLETTSTFRDAVLTAANLGYDADTVAAVTGQLAGAKYGLSGIPAEWLDRLAWRDRLMETGEKLYAHN